MSVTGAQALFGRFLRMGSATILAALPAGLAWPGAGQQPAAAHPFAPLAAVLQSPRCLNCHRSDDRPTQTDLMRVHAFNVQRGTDGRGVPGMRCVACHTERNNERIGIPGAPHWQMPPRSMGWQGLSQAALCRAILDRAKNGNRSPQALFQHLNSDPLALWAWMPGKERTPPPLSVEETRQALTAWIAAGTPCPDEKAASP